MEPTILQRSDHCVSRNNISKNALTVLYRLNEKGFKAYLAGGCVRDLMLGRQPKDFDVATDASPQEVKRCFRNCRLIGRRFSLAHVMFKDEIIEVATFRAPASGTLTETKAAPTLVTVALIPEGWAMVMKDGSIPPPWMPERILFMAGP